MAELKRSTKFLSMHPLKVVPFVAFTLALVACSTPAPFQAPAASKSPNTSGLPFGDMRVVSPAHLDQRPAPASMPSPFEFSAELAKRKIAGDAMIGFTISPQGKPQHIRVVQSTDPQLGQLAVDYVKRLTFRPARLGGVAVACEMEMPFSRK